MNLSMLDSLIDELVVVLLAGTPPLYLQLAAVTVVFIIARLWQIVRHRGRRAEARARMMTVGYFAVMMALSMGALETARRLYEDYVIVAISRLT